MTVEFHHGALCDSYEEQANAQGFTFGDKAEWVEKVGFGLICAHIHGCITDREFDKILQRFQTKILIKNIKPLESNANQHNSNALNALEGDTISRQKVLDVINLNWEYRRNCIRAIEKLPPVKQEPSSSENDLLQRLRKRISDLYNTDVTYDNGDYNTMDTPTLDKVLEYFDSEVNA